MCFEAEFCRGTAELSNFEQLKVVIAYLGSCWGQMD